MNLIIFGPLVSTGDYRKKLEYNSFKIFRIIYSGWFLEHVNVVLRPVKDEMVLYLFEVFVLC
jgi:hypothetical protein